MRIIAFVFIVLLSCGGPKKTILFKQKDNTSEVGLKALASLLEIDPTVLNQLVYNKEDHLELSVPYKGNIIDLELNKTNLFAPFFAVRTDKEDQVAYDPGLFYEGKIKGDPTSLVTISLFNDKVEGIISSNTLGTLNLGKTQDVALEYMLADPEALGGKFDFICGTPDEGIDAKEIEHLSEKAHSDVRTEALNTCVTVDFEMSYSNFVQFGSVAAVTNWITSIFVNVKTIYANEGINITIKSIYVWTTPDGYDVNTATALGQLRDKRKGDPNFTASVVHFVRGKTNAFSGIAYVGVVCLDSHQYGLSDVQFSFNPYPTYSWTVMVITHELGHNLGSNHTQSCSWPGGAIDNCYTTEGGCAPGPAPVNGGTIMSYCHMTSYGIKLQNGFGTYPGNAIRAHIGSKTCASCTTVPTTPTCADGVKNGTETGIDCGGSCPPCPVVVIPISQGKPAKMSSEYRTVNPYTASNGNDGNINTFMHTAPEVYPWWEVDLGGNVRVSSMRVVNRQNCCIDRVVSFMVFISESPLTIKPTSGWVYKHDGTQFMEITKTISGVGRYVRIWVENPQPRYMNLGEIQIFGVPVEIVCDTIKVPVITYRDSISCK